MIDLVRCAVLIVLLQAVPPPPAPADGSIRGRVTDEDTGEPIPHALVHVRRFEPVQDLQTIAAADGSYAFTGLAAARYEVRATAGEHLASHIPRAYSTSPSPASVTFIELDRGQVRSGIDIALQRSRAISGRVIDENGDAVTGVSVHLLRAPGGQRASSGGQSPRTDDLGAFRIFYVPPGQYFVCAEVSVSPRFSEHMAGARPLRVVSTCHPSATGDAQGRSVNLSTADIEGIEIRMPLHPGVTISGQVLDATGAPARGAQVSLSQFWRGSGGGSSRPLAEDGSFRISELPRGKYSLSATIGASGPKPAPDFQWAAVDLDIGSADVEGILLTLAPSARVKGRILYEDRPPAQKPPVQIQSEPLGMLRAPRPMTVAAGEDDRFELVGLAGPQVVGVWPAPAGSLVKSVRYRGRDITGIPTEFRSGPDEIEIVLTTRIARISGRVIDSAGNPAASARVVLFPADQARSGVRSLRSSATVRDDGSFTLPSRPAGDYLVIAMSGEDYDSLGDEFPYSRIAPLAERVTLHEHERRVLDLRLTPLSPVR